MMNITILSLLLASSFKPTSMSPLFSFTRSTLLNLRNSIFSRSSSTIIFSNGLGDVIEKSSITLYQSKFSHFLKTPVNILSDDPTYIYKVKKNTQYSQFWADSSVTIQILFCEFYDIYSADEGAAINIYADVNTIIRATIFRSISTTNTEGGVALYGGYGNHHKLLASYNCFSKCKAIAGSAINIYRASADIVFSSAFSCAGIDNTQSEAPFQIDTSNELKSSLINSNMTSCKTTISCGFCLDKSKNDEFKYLTFFDCSGNFIIDVKNSNENLALKNVNFIKCVLTDTSNQDRPSLIHIAGSTSTISNIFVFDCSLNAHSSSNLPGKIASLGIIDGQETNGEITITDLTTDLSQSDVSGSSEITITGQITFMDTTKRTPLLDNVLLAECLGNIIPPTLEPTPSQSPTASKSPLATPSSSPEATWDPRRTPTPTPSLSPSPSPTNPSRDLTTKEIAASVTTPSLFFLILLGIVVVMLLAKAKKKKVSSDMLEEEEEEEEYEVEILK